MGEKSKVYTTFPDDHILAASHELIPWFTDFVNYLASDIVPLDLSFHHRKKFMHDIKKFLWDDPYFYWSCDDGLIHRCVPQVVMLRVLKACHSSHVGGNHSGIQIAHKIFQCGYYLPKIHQDAHEFVNSCDRCERDGGISKRQELPLNPILVTELFDVWALILWVSL